MKNNQLKLILPAIFLMIMVGIHAQNVRVTGVVSDAQSPLIGVNVHVKGGTTGVITDMNGKYSIEYDLTKKNLERGSGVIDINLYGANLALDFIAKNNKITIDKLIAKDENQEKDSLILTGDIDLNKLDYNLLVESENFKVKENDLEILTTLKGKIYKEAEETGVNLDIKDFSLKYIGEINNIHGNLDLKKSKELYLDFNGEIGRLKYNDYDINGILLGFRIKNNIFELKDFDF